MTKKTIEYLRALYTAAYYAELHQTMNALLEDTEPPAAPYGIDPALRDAALGHGDITTTGEETQ